MSRWLSDMEIGQATPAQTSQPGRLREPSVHMKTPGGSRKAARLRTYAANRGVASRPAPLAGRSGKGVRANQRFFLMRAG